MEQDKKNALLIAASVIGFAYWILLFLSFWTGISWRSIGLSDIQAGFFEFVFNLVKNGELKLLLLGVLIIIAMIAPSILNLVGWKKNSKKIVVVAIILYFLTLNGLSLLLCVTGILWDSNNEFGTQEKKKNPLLIAAGILGILLLVFWFAPLMQKTDGSGSDSLFTAMFYGAIDSNDLFSKVLGINYSISLVASFVISIAISFFAKLRNNSKKVLIAAIFYIISLSIPSAILCFIAYAIMKNRKQKVIEQSGN